ncbi:MAG: hypothetical protein ABIP94_08120 [Planctomycetota bacterium]
MVGRTDANGCLGKQHPQVLVHEGATAAGLRACITGADGDPVAIDLHNPPTLVELEKLFVVYPGERAFELGERIVALPLVGLAEALRDL